MTADLLDDSDLEGQVRCPECGALMDEDEVTCPECGAEFGFYCPQCDEEVPPDATVCPHCGAELEEGFDDEPTPTVERAQFCGNCGGRPRRKKRMCFVRRRPVPRVWWRPGARC
jgi:predicted amidophosphoribosyltransferase